MSAHSKLYAVRLEPVLPGPQVVSEIDDPFVPQPDDLIVNLHESREVVDAFLESLPNIFAQNLSAESAMGPALQAAFMVMNPLGGKLLLFQSSVPSLGEPTGLMLGRWPHVLNLHHICQCGQGDNAYLGRPNSNHRAGPPPAGKGQHTAMKRGPLGMTHRYGFCHSQPPADTRCCGCDGDARVQAWAK